MQILQLNRKFIFFYQVLYFYKNLIFLLLLNKIIF